jgi:acyl-CoA thioesterase-1
VDRVRLPLLLLLLSLSGCHSSAPSSERPSADTSTASTADAPDEPIVSSSTAANPSADSASDSRPIIVAFGDSLTAGYGTNPGESYPDDLQRDLDARGYHYHVVNAGISGDTTKDGVERLASVVARHPRVVIVAFGGNDGLRGLPISSSRENLSTIVSTLDKAGAKIVLGGITLPPNYGPDYIRQFNETYALLARQYHAPLLPFLLKGVYGVPGGMQPDGLHATAMGNKTVANNLLPLLLPLLKK